MMHHGIDCINACVADIQPIEEPIDACAAVRQQEGIQHLACITSHHQYQLIYVHVLCGVMRRHAPAVGTAPAYAWPTLQVGTWQPRTCALPPPPKAAPWLPLRAFRSPRLLHGCRLLAQLVVRAGKRVALAGNIGPTLLDTLARSLDAAAAAEPVALPEVETEGE